MILHDLEQMERMLEDQERVDVNMTPRYLKENTSSRVRLLSKRVGREEVKVMGLRVTIIYLALLMLIVRC